MHVRGRERGVGRLETSSERIAPMSSGIYCWEQFAIVATIFRWISNLPLKTTCYPRSIFLLSRTSTQWRMEKPLFDVGLEMSFDNWNLDHWFQRGGSAISSPAFTGGMRSLGLLSSFLEISLSISLSPSLPQESPSSNWLKQQREFPDSCHWGLLQVWLDPGTQCPQAHVLILTASPRPLGSVSLCTLASSSPPTGGK